MKQLIHHGLPGLFGDGKISRVIGNIDRDFIKGETGMNRVVVCFVITMQMYFFSIASAQDKGKNLIDCENLSEWTGYVKANSSINSVKAGDMIIAADGKTNYQVVVPDGDTDPGIKGWLEKSALLIKRAFSENNIEMPVVFESKADKKISGIYLGNTEFAKSCKVSLDNLEGWSFIHKAVGENIIIAGNDKAGIVIPGKSQKFKLGTVKGVTAFLHKYMGVRFLYPADNPESVSIEYLNNPTVKISKDLDIVIRPNINYNSFSRGIVGFYEIANNFFPAVDFYVGHHTWTRAVPLEKYRETNPEYFALRDGQRSCNIKTDKTGRYWKNHLTQYCLANSDVQELIYQHLLKTLDKGYSMAAVEQPDGFKPCQCEKCHKLYNTGDNWGEKIWIFHHHLAERLAKERPDKKVLLSSYMVTENPPKTKTVFSANTVIALCSYSDKGLKKWRHISVPGGFMVHTYNWGQYHLAGSYLPKRTPTYISAQVKRFYKNNIRSIDLDGFGENFGLEAPVYYVYGRMFDNPENLKAKDLLEEFYQAAFGSASSTMRDFYNLLHHSIAFYSDFLAIQEIKTPIMSYTDIYGKKQKYFPSDSINTIRIIYTPELITSLDKKLSEAEKTEVSEKVKTRLILIRKEFDYLKNIANVVNLYSACKVSRDHDSVKRLLCALDEWNSYIDNYSKNRLNSIVGWPEMRLFGAMGLSFVKGKKNNFLAQFKDTPLNWDVDQARKKLEKIDHDRNIKVIEFLLKLCGE
ncbi:MAG: DUF4838 domain-containing protein [Planctomycetota bacterium]|jgi:hypothetical protein